MVIISRLYAKVSVSALTTQLTIAKNPNSNEDGSSPEKVYKKL
jgi:hypothetical protein